jgi:hypothetical protein
MSSRFSPTFIAAVCRAEYLALAVFRGRQLLEIRQHRVSVPRRSSRYLGQQIIELALDYGARHVVIEPDSFLAGATLNTTITIERLALRQGERWHLGITSVLSEQDLLRELVERYPELQRFVTVYANTGHVAMDRWNITQLFAVALGITFAETLPTSSITPPSSSTLIFSSSSYAPPTHPRAASHAHEVRKTAPSTR